MTFPEDAVLKPGSLVLVTGVTGFVASVIADELLAHRYRVRGTTRDVQSKKADWMPEHFKKKYGSGQFEMVQVPDMEEDGCLDHAVADCSALIHVASVVALEPNPHNIITPSLRFLANALAAARKTPTLQRFVLTSSSAAALPPTRPSDESYDITPVSWADWAVSAAWAPPPYTPDRALPCYFASKVQTERALWDALRAEPAPHFAANAVLPDFVLGTGVDVRRQGYASSVALLKQVFDNDPPEVEQQAWRAWPPQWSVDVRDVALLHLAALVHPEVEGQRIFAYAHRKTWGEWIGRLRGMYPGRRFPEPDPNEGVDRSNVVGREQAEDLLRWMGRSTWRPLDESLREVCDTMV